MDKHNFRQVMGELLNPLKEQLKEQAAAIEALKNSSSPSTPTKTQKEARLAEIRAQQSALEEENARIAANTGTRPPPPKDNSASLASALALSLASIASNPSGERRPRFNPTTLPKFTRGNDLEQWIPEVQLDVDTHGEKLICQYLWKYCFRAKSSTRAWWSMLDSNMITWATKGSGCWQQFATMMREA